MAYNEEDRKDFINRLEVAFYQMSHPDGSESTVNISALSLANKVYASMHLAVRKAESGYLDTLCDYITDKFGKKDAHEVRRRMEALN